MLYFVSMLICANIEDEAKQLIPGLQFAYDRLAELALKGDALPDAPAQKPQGLYVIEYGAFRVGGWLGRRIGDVARFLFRCSCTWNLAGSKVEAEQIGRKYAEKKHPRGKGWRGYDALATEVDPAYVRQAYHAQRGE